MSKRKLVVGTVVFIVLLVGVLVLVGLRKPAISITEEIPRLVISSSAFDDMGTIPIQYTGEGLDFSPDLRLAELNDRAVSVSIIMEDLDVPIVGTITHWVIWNIPATDYIPYGIKAGETVEELGNAVQGMAYGIHQYAGPKPPFGTHRYRFHVFVLDKMLDLPSSSTVYELLPAMNSHILQYGSLTGWFPSGK